MKTPLFFFLLLLALPAFASGPKEPIDNIHVMMMRSTCKITGDGSGGTGFIIGKLNPEQQNGVAYYTLITANHVLEQS
jgi:hypothetical protein